MESRRPPAQPGELRAQPQAEFIEGDPSQIRVGNQSLGDYLRSSELTFPLELRSFLKTLDYELFTANRKAIGRRAIHPRLLIGLITYGLVNAVTSLRGLEDLARRDVGAWWVADGQQPDHSTIGKFVADYAEALTGDFFIQLTAQLVARSGRKSGAGVAAIDGTVIEAVSSRASLLTAEALQQRAAAARVEVQASGAPESIERAERFETALQVAVTRDAMKKVEGDKSKTSVSPIEPEAVLQPRKDGPKRPAYKPSVVTNDLGFILGQQVDPSSETAVVSALLDQYAATAKSDPLAVLMDAGYFCSATLQLALDRSLNVLIPSGKADGEGAFERKTRTGIYTKSEFRFDEALDTYICPAGLQMRRHSHTRDRHGEHVRYMGTGCGTCPLRSKCTPGKARTVRRYVGDDVKDAMVQVLAQPAARREYSARKALVEPIFGRLKHDQSLRRFRRRGLRAVRAEFGLHCMAYNLKKGLFRAVVVAFLVVRLPGEPWRMVRRILVAQ